MTQINPAYQIQEYMTPMPHTIGRTIAIQKAQEMMKTYQIRHLPVQERGKLLGVLTDRDIKLSASFSHANELTVEDVMTPEPYVAHPETSLTQVLHTMYEHRIGCVIILEPNGKIMGIFTAHDAVRVLAHLIETQSHSNQRKVIP